MSIIKRGFRFLKNRAKRLIYFIPNTKAYYSLTKLQDKYPDSAIFITSYALGDLVYAMAYMKEWQIRNPTKKIVLIADPNKKSVIDSYNENYEVIYYGRNTKMGKSVLVHLNGSRFYSFVGRKRYILNTIPDQIYGRRTGKDNLTLMREYFQLPQGSAITYPCPHKVTISSIAEFEENKSKIAVVNAYSGGKTTSECIELLENIVDILKKHGFIVYSNIIGEQKPLPGTYSLRCDLLELYSIVDEISLFVSVRSGIVDWLISAKSKKFVIYGARTNDNFARLFALSAWGECNCKEVHMSKMRTEDVLNALERYIGE